MKALTILLLGIFLSPAAFGQDPQGTQANPPSSEPVLLVNAGPCTADFVVRDASGKGLYDAKITLQAQYGFMGLRKLDLNVGTNSEGKARIEGLPEKIRKAADFKIAQGGREKTLPYDPVRQCHAQHEVVLSDPAPRTN